MPLTYGFRAYPPRAAIFRHPFTGAVIATPVLDLSSNLGPQGYADRSGTGANGTPVGAPTNARGVFDETIRFGGVRDTLNCGSNAALDIAGDISGCLWLEPKGVPAGYILVKTNNVTGWQLVHNGVADQRLVFLTYTGPFAVSSTVSVYGPAPRHCAFTVKSNLARIFVDGIQDGRATVSMGDAAAESLWIASWRNLANWREMSVELPQLWNGALSPEQIYKNYLAAKDVPIYLNDFSSYAVTPVAKAVGSVCGPYRILGGAMNVVEASGYRWVEGSGGGQIDGVMPWPENNAYGTYECRLWKSAAAGNMAFMPIASSGTAVFLTAGQNGYCVYIDANEAVYLYRIAGAVATTLMQTANGYVSNASDYDFRLVRRVGGAFALYIRGGGTFPDWTLVNPSVSGTNPVTDNTYTTAPYSLFETGGANRISQLRFSRVCERPASFPWEFSATGTWAGLVSAGQVWMRCLTSGNVYLPKDLDWQTCDLKLYKGADANVTDVLLVATELGGTTAASQNGYCLRLSSDERVQLIRMDNGVVTVLAQTAAAYVALTTEYSFHITRVGSTGAFTVSILGGAYATWTEAVTATDNTYILGNYFNVDIDADDRITSPVFAAGLKAAA